MKSTTVSINGTIYDVRTGMPITKDRSTVNPAQHSAHTVHAQPQRSTTLNRRYVRNDAKPVPKVATPAATQPQVHSVHIPQRQRAAAPSAMAMHRPVAPRRVIHPAKTPVTVKPTAQAVAKLAHTPVAHHATHKPIHQATTPASVPISTAPARHATVERAQQRVEASKPQERVLKPSQVIKQEAIAKAMEQSKSHRSHKHNVKAARKQRNPFARFMGVASASMAVLLLGAYFTYLNMPALSTRVAAAQAGVDASYPGYSPSGYSLNGPVAYEKGSVTMQFAANAGPQNYSLSQQQSNWDSTALLEDYVAPQAGSNYITTTAGGLTIYSYGDTSVWVNNGILYTIKGNNNLSDQQIQRIASSL